MNHHSGTIEALVHGVESHSRRHIVDCNLPVMTDIILSSMKTSLERRKQEVSISLGTPVTVQADLFTVFSLISAMIAEAAGLSSAYTTLRIRFDDTDDAAAMIVEGANYHQIAATFMKLDPALVSLADDGGAKIALIWNEHEGPTVVLRFPKT